jgi:uncharacterized protein (TIGR03086 family)
VSESAAATASGLLLADAISYALGNVEPVTPDLLARPTPCRQWNLRMLLQHGCESLAALEEGFATGCVRLTAAGDCPDGSGPDGSWPEAGGPDGSWPDGSWPEAGGPDGSWPEAGGPAGVFVTRARSLLACWARAGSPAVAIGGLPLAAEIVAAAGALEIAVHGWDVAQASGSRLAIPPSLAARLLQVAPLLVAGTDRPQLFAAPVAVRCEASASEKLTAFLGRPVPD